MRLFDRQPAHKRSLLHCDHLVSLVHFRAFMASLGRAAFNARIAAYGPEKIKLRWNLFTDLEPERSRTPAWAASVRSSPPTKRTSSSATTSTS